MIKVDLARENQVHAADPATSTWLSANAGSGKTKVLTDRVALLLLEGVAPERILCLTYTKAAASEMQNRLFRLLGGWAMTENKELYKKLTDIGLRVSNNSEKLRHARTLFTRAIETPGGLKVQTIHSFCASLLRQFPLEAGVSPVFTEIDERRIKDLSIDILENLAGSEHAGIINDLACFGEENSLDNLIASLLRARQNTIFETNRCDILKSLGLPRDFEAKHLVSSYLFDSDLLLLRKMSEVLQNGGKTDQVISDTLSRVTEVSQENLELLQDAFLIKSAPFSVKVRGISVAMKTGPLAFMMHEVDDLMVRVQESKQTALAFFAAKQTLALYGLAEVFIPAYEREKQLKGWLDFDDLILKTRNLLSNPIVADWVLYRLDGGISHILVDEAQDTSPLQWEVISKLAQEITSGEGSRAQEHRTIFVVGDKKQSIYSFQGADADAFDYIKQTFSDQLALSSRPLKEQSLEYSFRSSAAILRVVDETFANKAPSGFSKLQRHLAFNSQMPGRVDIWPLVPTSNEDKDEEWYDPVDLPRKQNHHVTLARQIAVMIKEMIDKKQCLPIAVDSAGKCEARAVNAGDFLILVQQRKDIFHEIIQACKALDLPISGADRLKLRAEVAVKDLIALLDFLALPEDDLSLAVALKSPFFGWSEQKLFDIAHNRGAKYLWEAMQDSPKVFEEELSFLSDLIDKADFLRPYDLLERVLTLHQGREKLIARLGLEAEDGINEMLGQALSYEQTEIPSLTGFLIWIKSDDLEIKRQVENDGRQIRVMTIHGAKGLESPIVILPDTAKREPKTRDGLLTSEGYTFWKPKNENLPKALAALNEKHKQKELQERDRLLYVAMTRAKNWLIVLAAGELGGDMTSWYEQIEAGMEKAGSFDYEFEGGLGKRVSFGNWDNLFPVPLRETKGQNTEISNWLFERSPVPSLPEAPLVPSNLGGAKALTGDCEQVLDTRRGSQIHLLLEKLPSFSPAEWPKRALSILEKYGFSDREEDFNEIITETLAVLNDDTLSFIFAEDSLAEVSISAPLKEYGYRLMNGIMDRLVVKEKEIFLIDFKTNRTIPESSKAVPEGLLRQLGAYTSALSQIYPKHQIKPCILWTAKPVLMYFEADEVIGRIRKLSHA